MTEADAERRRLRMVVYELASAAFYLSRIEGEEAVKIREALLGLIERCKGLVLEKDRSE